MCVYRLSVYTVFYQLLTVGSLFHLVGFFFVIFTCISQILSGYILGLAKFFSKFFLFGQLCWVL